MTHHELALQIHLQGYHSVFRPLPGVICGRRAQTPVGHERGLAPALAESATKQGLVETVPSIANKKAWWLEAWRSAIYRTSEACCAGC